MSRRNSRHRIDTTPRQKQFGNPQGQNVSTLKALYEKLATDREPYLNRARVCSALTIPALVPPQGNNGSQPLPTPYQSLGARGVNNLTAKLLFVVLPANEPFFEYRIAASVRRKLGATLGEAEQALQQMVDEIVTDIETSGSRPQLAIALKHLVVAGNVLSYDDPKDGIRVFPLTQYVIRRTPSGRNRLCIVREEITRDDIPESMEEMLPVSGDESKSKFLKEETLELFTVVEWQRGRATSYQELQGIRVPDSEGSWPEDICPWNPMRMIPVENEDYGRSYVEEYIGDLQSLETLTRSMVRASVAAAKLLLFVNPNGMTDPADVDDSEGGDVVDGNASDVTAMQLQKASDFQVAEQRIQKLSESLAYAFLLNSAVQRKGERVTLGEVRIMSQDIEAQLGGVYSYLGQGIQIPLARVREAKLRRAGKFPALPPGLVTLAITTGVEAIGRGNDFDRLNQWSMFMQQTLGPEAAMQRINADELGKRSAHALGIDDTDLMMSEEQLQAEQQRQQQAAMMQAAVAPTINQAGQMAQSQQAAPPPSQ